MNSKIDNILCCRKFPDGTDPMVLQLYVAENKRILERVFYDNYLICSWAVKNSAGYTGDVIYCKGKENPSADKNTVNSLFSIAAEKFKNPDYEKYKAFFQARNGSRNINGKIIQFISDNKNKILDEDSFNSNISLISAGIKEKFVNLNESSSMMSGRNIFKAGDLTEKIEKGKFSFMGCCQYPGERTLYSVVVYKLLEKCYGFGESGTIYNSYRMNGDIYSACTAYSVDDNIFYTGILSDYNDDLFNDVTEKIKHIDFCEEQLEQVKQRILDDLHFSSFQYGEEITVMPYILNTGKDISLSDITKMIEKISMDDIKSMDGKEKYLLKMVV